MITLEVCRRIYHYKIQVKFDICNNLQNFCGVMALFQLRFCYCIYIGFCCITFARDALISLEVCRRIYHCKMQVKFDICNHPQNFGRVMALVLLSFCWCVDIGFNSITFAGMH